MSKKVRAKRNFSISDTCYSVEVGCVIRTTISKEQIWTAQRQGKYWNLSRKGSGFTLRITERVFNNNFEEV